MENSLLNKIVDRIRSSATPGKITAVLLMVVFSLYHFHVLFGCSAGEFACGKVQNFSFIFPLYLLSMVFFNHVATWSYVFLYIASTLFYSYIFYQIAGWIEERYTRFAFRPRMTLKKI